MGFLIVDTGLEKIFLRALATVSQDDLTVGLYVNNHTPAAGDLPADYTVPTDAAYSPADLLNADWIPTQVASVEILTSLPRVFSFSTSVETIYGYYVYDVVAGVLYWAQDFAVPFVLPGVPIVLTLTIDIQYQNCP